MLKIVQRNLGDSGDNITSSFVYSSCLDEDVAKELESVTKHVDEDSEEEYADYGEEEDNERDEF